MPYRDGCGTRAESQASWWPAIAWPMIATSAVAAGVSCTMRPSQITTMRSDDLQQLVEVLADEQHGRAVVARRQQPVVDLGHRGEVEAEDRIGRDQQRHVL